MKKYLLLLVFTFNSCAIEGEVFRLQTRINTLYQLLNDQEEKLFAEQKIDELGESLDFREENDESFRLSLREIRIKEAIMSFNGKQTAHFFYHILLRDLAKFSYEEFLNDLSTEEKILFASQDNLESFTNKKEVLTRAKKHFGFESFSDIQIIQYYKTISFQANFYPNVYDILAFLARYRTLDAFLQQDYIGALVAFDNIQQLIRSRRIPVRKQGEKDLATWQELKSRVYMQDLSNEQFLRVLTDVLPHMDPTVSATTINNIRNRFKEQ